MIYNLRHWMRCFCVGLFYVSILIGFSSCKKKKQDIVVEHYSNSLPADFYDFYNQFHSDSMFQMNHISFPLKGETTDPPIRQNAWILHKPFDSINGTFERDFRVLGSALVAEYIYDKSGNFAMERRFGKLNDGWNLIYYVPMQLYNESIIQ